MKVRGDDLVFFMTVLPFLKRVFTFISIKSKPRASADEKKSLMNITLNKHNK